MHDARTTARRLLLKHRHTANSLGEHLKEQGSGGGNQVAMSRLLDGKNVRVSTLEPIASYFGVDPSAFVTETAATAAAIALGLEGKDDGVRQYARTTRKMACHKSLTTRSAPKAWIMPDNTSPTTALPGELDSPPLRPQAHQQA